MLLKTLININICKAFVHEPFHRSINSATANITRLHRTDYGKQYPTVVVLPDGSSICIRYSEPRKIIKLPLDLNTLTDSERKARLTARKPRKAVKVLQEVEDNFQAIKYMKMIKKKKIDDKK